MALRGFERPRKTHERLQRAMPNRTTTLRVLLRVSDAPTIRALPEERLPRGTCNLLVLRMNGATANMRQSLRVDLPHMLRLAAPNALVVAASDSPCPEWAGMSAMSATSGDIPREHRYSGPFWPRFKEQCWLDRWSDLIASHTLSGARPCSVGRSLPAAGSGAGADGTPSGALPDGVWCEARLIGRSLCQRRAPLLLNATRHVVGFPDATTMLRKSLRYFSAISCEGGDESSSPNTWLSSGPSSLAPSPVGSRPVCLLFKSDTQELWVGGLASADGVTFEVHPLIIERLLLASSPTSHSLY